MWIQLRRLDTGDEGTFGELLLPSGKVLHTIELPWRGNNTRMSCIPPGTYDAKRVHSPRFGKVLYRLSDAQTAPRSAILIHAGNRAGDTDRDLRSNFLGCIGLGTKRGTLSGQAAILNSSKAMEIFHAETGGHPIVLSIQPIKDGAMP